jgi:hypothetical protein
MKLNRPIKNMYRSIMLNVCLLTLAFGMEPASDVTYHKVKAVLEEHLEKNPDLLNSSKARM